ncbi:MAG: NAD(P)/FAD-dependent oxidoreductase [Acidobacteriota bacterium]
MAAVRVVIVGGGFGGLNAARAFKGAPVQVTLIDKRNYHLFRPLLYQVAAGLLSPDEIAPPLRCVFSRQRNVDVLMDEVVGIDTLNRLVRLKDRGIPYDFLILATGIRYNYFGHDEWSAVATPLESLEGADVIRTKVLAALERAENMAAAGEAPADEIQRELTVALVGGGTVGVEMAGTLAEMFQMALKPDFRHIDPRSARILLYEAGPRVLPTYRENLSQDALRHLEGLGVEVHCNTRVTGIDGSGVVAGGQTIAAATVIWAAGVVASPAAQWLGVTGDASGRIVVNPDMSVPGHPEIFAIGDTAHVVAPSRNLLGISSGAPAPLPGVAQPAIQEGRYVARLIRSRATQGAPPAPFTYLDKGDLAIVGRTYAVADLRLVRFAGFPAWFVWAAVHIYFLIGFANRVFVLMQWAFAFVTMRRRGRVID